MKTKNRNLYNRQLPPLGRTLMLCLLSLCHVSCKKNVEIPPPVTSITSSQVFSTDQEAIYAMSGLYGQMINTVNINFMSGSLTLYGGISADELVPFGQGNDTYNQFFLNHLTSINMAVNNLLWIPAYSDIYSANAILEGLNDYKGVSDSTKNELIGEAEFARAICNFYLVNLYGDIPLVTTTNWRKTDLLGRSSQSLVYQSIIADLQDAQKRLRDDYAAGKGERIIPNKWAATALLARVYLYQGNWANAEAQASAVIQYATLYGLTTNLRKVFSANSTEAIWQLQINSNKYPYTATPEGNLLIPPDSLTQPFAFLSNSLLNSFELHDLRKIAWIDSSNYSGKEYYYPYKYTTGPTTAVVNAQPSQYYMVLRLAEQYLIRAEAEAHNGEANAINDLDMIRNRAGLPNYNGAIDQNSLLAAIAHENQIEFFAEWGHRWLDLKRTGQAALVLSGTKNHAVGSNALLYPVPINEIRTDPNLTQNPGY